MYKFEIRLQNGDMVYDSSEHKNMFYTKEYAEAVMLNTLDDVVESQDCDDEDKFTHGDYRMYIKEIK